MSWLEKLLPPKIQQTDPADRRTVPEGLWVKCPSCETVLYNNDLEQNQNVCPSCGHHHRITNVQTLIRVVVGLESPRLDPTFARECRIPQRQRIAL